METLSSPKRKLEEARMVDAQIENDVSSLLVLYHESCQHNEMNGSFLITDK